MLQMDCSQCGELIKSPQLAEMQVMPCPKCEEIVVVKNVVISDRNTALNFRTSLKDFLLTARDKFRSNKPHNAELQTKYDLNRRLAKLLRRDDFRLTMSYDLYVQINFETKRRLARLLNISSSGAAVEFSGREQVPEESSEANFQLLLPGHEKSLALPAQIIWSKMPPVDTIAPATAVGMMFKKIDEDIRDCLWDFIVKTETEDHQQA
jgi:hypothetical protein